MVLLCVALIIVIAVQIGRVSELASRLRGEEDVRLMNNQRNGYGLLLFMVGFLILTIATSLWYKNYFLGYGPHESASEHGGLIDSIFNWTLFFTGIVFVLTHILLFYYAFKYRERAGSKAQFISHNNTLEVVWTIIPAVVMAFLVIGGLDVWNEVMSDVDPNDPDVLEIEATGYQFGWELRYPGPDGKLGTRDYALIDGVNNLGQDWTDPKNHDDFKPQNIVLPKGQKVRVRITARDVLHDFYLPQFRVKMDAVPGMPTYFIFTPDKTTEEYREELSNYPEYNVPDPDQPEKMKWETYQFELACAELCGIGHWSMKKTVTIVEPEEYEAWLNEQQSYYFSNIRGTENDPLRDQLLDTEVEQRREEFQSALSDARTAESTADRTIVLNYVTFETGSAELTELSRYQLDDVVSAMAQYPDLQIELSGHTDNTGDAAANLALSQERADRVLNYLTDKGVDVSRLRAVGYGATRPVESNDTEEGRAQNRRIEFTILSGGQNQDNSAS
jgi:cytochrome c oxidase subunit 2